MLGRKVVAGKEGGTMVREIDKIDGSPTILSTIAVFNYAIPVLTSEFQHSRPSRLRIILSCFQKFRDRLLIHRDLSKIRLNSRAKEKKIKRKNSIFSHKL